MKNILCLEFLIHNMFGSIPIIDTLNTSIKPPHWASDGSQVKVFHMETAQ